MNNETALNPDLCPAAGSITLINPECGHARADLLPAGTLLGEKYRIVRPLTSAAGEADIYLCEENGTERVAKVYRRQRAAKPEVVSALRKIDSPRIAPLHDAGEIGGRPYEVLPYYKNGSLQGRTYSLEELKKTIIPAINEALHILHGSGVIHKDLKPSNIMLQDDGTDVAVIDFGVSSVVEEGSTVLFTCSGMTPEYSAPETFRGLFLEESDYYSFGVTLFELYCGYTPYKNMSAEEIARFTAVQRIPFPKDMPRELRELISAMTYYDITNRHEKANPNRRWTYREVCLWLEGRAQALPGEGLGTAAGQKIPPITLAGREYTDLPSLVAALAEMWQEGKGLLFGGRLAAYFSGFLPEYAALCAEAEEEAARAAGKDDIVYQALLCQLAPDLRGFYWKGQVYGSLPALGRDMLERLWNGDLTNAAFWDGILREKLLSNYLANVHFANAELGGAIAALETAHAQPDRSDREALADYYALAYLLSGQKLLRIDGRNIKSIEELTAYKKELLAASYAHFEDLCHRLIGYDDVLDAQFETWLIALGRRRELEAWRFQLAQ